VIVKNAIFGNPWHGKLSTGSIELVPDTPVTSITVDGVEHTVETVTGNLGNTRYLKAPGIAEATTPTGIAALDGEYMNDAVLFSEEYRYSPLADYAVVSSEDQWLLFDETLQRWRKMNVGHTFGTPSNNPASPSPAGTTVVNVAFHRGIEFGKFDRIDGEATTDAQTFIGSANLGLTYAYTPLTRPSAYPFDPTTMNVSIAVRPDGRAILVKLEAKRWDDFTISDTPLYDDPFTVYDDSQTWIFNVWEIVFSDDGSEFSTPTEVWPDVPNVEDPVNWYENQVIDIGDVWWTYNYIPTGTPPYWEALYYVPLTLRIVGNYDAPGYLNVGYETSIIVGADYDKDGNKRLSYFRMMLQTKFQIDNTADGYVGSYVQNSEFDPADHIPSYTISTSVIHHEPHSAGYDYLETDYPDVISWDNYTSGTTTLDTSDKLCGVFEDGTALKTWDTKPPGTLSFRWKTNNVSELYTGTTSHLRIGPGDADDSALTTSDYASFNPRTGVVVSSESPIGFV
jgi:hypothetical protein